MNALTAIHSRRTVHRYRPSTVDNDALMRILDAAHQAPCHKLTWPWRFVVVGPTTRERLLEPALRLAACKYSRCDDDPAKLPPKLREKVRNKLLDPGALVVVLLRRDPDPFRDRENYAATACAIQNLLLAATHEGLGSKWGTGGVTRDAQTASILGVDTASEEVVGFIFLGEPETVPKVERPPVADHTTHLP